MRRIGGFVLVATLASGGPWSAVAFAQGTAPQESWFNKLTFSGYVTASYTYAVHHADGAIVGRLYDRFHDQIEMNAASIAVEKAVATDKWDAGARVDLLFGEDAPTVQSAGLNLGTNGDLIQAFATVNIPAGNGNYVQFKAGKMVTLMGLEVIQDVLNPNLSEGNQFIYFENFTNTGLRMDAKVSPVVDVELALIGGWDVVADNNTKKSFMGRLGLTLTPRASVALLGYLGNEKAAVGGVTPSGNRYGGEFLVTQKVGSKGTLYAQGDYGQEKDLPAAGSTAKWWAAGVWATYDVTPKVTVALRGDYADDRDGVRTSGLFGFPANTGQTFGGGTLTLNVKAWQGALIRPEIRYDRSSLPLFNGAADPKKDQVSFALGVSYLF